MAETRQEHQLIIIGNGFDLSCGLPSGFLSFFSPRLEKLEMLDDSTSDELVGRCRDLGLTAWDMLLATFRKRLEGADLGNWCDVESAISMVVLDTGWNDAGINPSSTMPSAYALTDCLQWLGVDDKTKRMIIGCEPGMAEVDEGGECDFLLTSQGLELVSGALCDDDVAAIAEYLNAAYNQGEWTIERVLASLLAELNELEKQFSDYLTDALRDHPGYCSESASLLKTLVEYDNRRLTLNSASTTVLNFNYTTPGECECSGGRELDLLNVHGKLGGDIVFGIDGTGCMDEANAAMFTKTYRLLGFQRATTSKPVAYGEAKLGDGLCPATVAIKVYGHSLSAADYSYFQSIFDIVNLYGSSVKLYFFYSNYCDTARDDMFHRVTALLSAYGETMDNKDHGKNLIHKLILEGRLAIVEI